MTFATASSFVILVSFSPAFDLKPFFRLVFIYKIKRQNVPNTKQKQKTEQESGCSNTNTMIYQPLTEYR